MRVVGYSVLEVIVSSVIILITFLLFSMVLGQMFSATPVITQVKAIYTLNSLYGQDEEDLDAERLGYFFPGHKMESTKEFLPNTTSSIYAKKITVLDARNKPMVTLYQYFPASNSRDFFQH